MGRMMVGGSRRTDGHDAEGPDVDFGTVLFARDDFGRHPVRCADHRRALCVRRVADLRAETKVGCKPISNIIQKAVERKAY